MTDSHNRPRHNEEEYFVRHEAGRLKAHREAVEGAARAAERRTHYMKCPKCGADLAKEHRAGVEIEKCPECLGIWLDPGDAQILTRHGAQEAAHSLLTALAHGMRTSHAVHATPEHEPHKG
jgi:Zn-finger nucleic acid-binding protein